MRIGVDAHPLATFRKGGIYRYTKNLINWLAKIDDKNEYFIYLPEDIENNTIEFKENFKKRVIGKEIPADISPRNLKHAAYTLGIYEQFIIPSFLKKDRIDIFHSSYEILPISKVCKSIATIHDVGFLDKRTHRFYSKKIRIRRYFRDIFTKHQSIKRADKLIAVSMYTMKNIVQICKVPKEKIEVIHLGAEEIFKPIDKNKAKEKTEALYNTTRKFILYIDVLSPEAGTLSILKAILRLKKKRIPHKLVMVGPPPEAYNLKELIIKMDLKEHAIVTGYVSDEDLALLYNAADLLVYPPEYEGFGLPPLEAMSCGLPVISVNSGPIPEVVGDAGILLNHVSEASLEKAMFDVLTNKQLQIEFRKRGLERAKLFSWNNTANKTLKVYKSLINLP